MGLVCASSASTSADSRSGSANAITDVSGVTVGHVTIWRDEPEPPAGRGIARTGVTAVLPGSIETLHAEPVPAGTAVLNGAGELTGSLQIADWGCIETPVYLTSTHAVGRVYDGAVRVAVDAEPRVGTEDFVIPVVGECDDSWLSEGRIVQVEAEDVARAVAAAGGAVAEGAVGAGTGMMTKGYKAGIGTASRIAPSIGARSASSSSRTSIPRPRSSWTAFQSVSSSASRPTSGARKPVAASPSWRSTRRSPRTSSSVWRAAQGSDWRAAARSPITAAERSSCRSLRLVAARAERLRLRACPTET